MRTFVVRALAVVITATCVGLVAFLLLREPQLRVVAMEHDKDRVVLRVELSNPSPWPRYYYGYSEDSPVYGLEVLTDAGWNDQNFGWCGTGLEAQKIGAFEKVEFPVYATDLELKGPLRVCLSLSRSEEGEWTDTYTPRLESLLKPEALDAQ